MSDSRFVILEDRGILAVSGEDRGAFLQGLVSNDTAKVSGERAVYAAFLTPQGKYLHDFIMVEHGGTIWLDGEAARLPDLKKRLSIYRLRAKAALGEMPDLAVAVAFGAGALAALGLPAAEGAARPLGDGVALVDPRLAALGARVILPRTDARATLSALDLAETEFAAYDRHRLALGVPDGCRDLVVDRSILLEAGFDELHGVDWNKGCYIGQELTARTKYRGLVKRRLFPVRLGGPAPEPGAILTLGGREAGEMRSSNGNLGLALLRLEAVDALKRPDNEAGVVAIAPEWMRIEP